MPNKIVDAVRAAGPVGMRPEALQAALPGISRSTLNRRLAALCRDGSLQALGAGRATRYVVVGGFTRAEIDAYFSAPANSRAVAPFRPDLLDAAPGLDASRAARLRQIQALAQPLDRKFLSEFLIDFTWASSLLEGSSYSALDTAALVKYGQQSKTKPTEDAVLALNHKRAGERLWTERLLSVENVCAMHALLTDPHELIELDASDHFLPAEQRGRPRVYEDVRLQNSAYLPPFRPGTSHAAELLAQIMTTAAGLPPIEAAFYLLTRIAYAQSFANGNKRTSRIAANLPLLAAGLLPFSFVDVDKADYIRGLAAFYELGSTTVIEQTFVSGYVRSIARGSRIPDALRVGGFDLDAACAALVGYVNSGQLPSDPRARVFVTGA
jgi:hypothetical protein